MFWVKHLFALQKIPQRKFQRQIRELEEKVVDLENQIELQKRGFEQEIDYQEKVKKSLMEIIGNPRDAGGQLRDHRGQMDHAMRTISNIEMAINQYHQERNNLRMQLVTVETSRYEIITTRHGRCWHLNQDCPLLAQAGVTKVLQPCTGCT